MANSVQAATVQFNDLASFNAATTTQNIDFEGLAGGTGSTFYDSGLTINGVNFIGVTAGGDGFPFGIVAQGSFPGDFGSGTTIRSCSGCLITATLPSGITAVSGEFASLETASVPFLIRLSTGETFNINSPVNGSSLNFAGFTSDTPISSISFRGLGDSNSFGGGTTRLDNFRFGTVNAAATTAVPEPFTVIGTLVGGTAALRMRKKLKSAVK
ncbi:PEP-CTERM sorting domain-containing protein [Chamaesiphon polymorphus]|uniref:PEP-CTERM sorting domain-containing protein n=1 Tax=Chamaesiphon polymorphus CCALA 037 TaxID=2107692 RepID=A0A2T1GD97_9CYAN|nr:PEP-CTERM sorting domain-containing protein [Chamaesiphon polymorphus]PSB55450.1 hypothetical protein C7B77_15000 [Chamaesiphon polymorphus CCALA 037]